MTKQILQKPKTIIEKWARLVGYHKRALAKAADLIGMSAYSIGQRNNGAVAVPKIERLGLTAAWLGIPEFSPEMYDLPEDRKAVAIAAGRVIREALSGQCPEATAQPPATAPGDQQEAEARTA